MLKLFFFIVLILLKDNVILTNKFLSFKHNLTNNMFLLKFQTTYRFCIMQVNGKLTTLDRSRERGLLYTRHCENGKA